MNQKVLLFLGILAIVFIAFFLGRETGKGTYIPEVQEDQKLGTNHEVVEFFGNRTTYSNVGLSVNCSGLDLELTSICLNYYVNKIFNYTTTDDSIYLSDFELKKSGGDCKDYSDFLEREFSKYGYETQRIKVNVIQPVVEDGIAVNPGLNHIFIVVHDSERYCVMDMTKFKCFSYQDIVNKIF